MEVRPIDAVQVLNNINLHHRPTPVSEFESGFNDGLNQAMWEITHAPTLTPPNEPLTCEGCVYLKEIAAPCACCARMKREVDHYLPLEKGEKDGTD